MEVSSGTGASNDGRHFIVIAAISDDETDVGFRASEDDDTGGHGSDWTRGVKFH